ncbi:MAG: ABC transporter permease [Chloroflexi bacterium]|nr:ABC transporter permease [Chloroflexota bacterium]
MVRKKVAMAALAVIVILYLSGIFAAFIAPRAYAETNLRRVRQAPSSEYWLGTDSLGRDIFSRVIWGIQTTVIVTFTVALTGISILGVTFGLIAGYRGGFIDAVITRVGEVVAIFPDVLLIIILAATLRPRILDWLRSVEDATDISGLVSSGAVDYMVIGVALLPLSWFGMMRLVRGQVLYLRKMPYVDAARGAGVSTWRILFVHLLPNSLGPIIVTTSFTLGAVAGSEIFLSFLGLGVQPPRPSLGAMIADVSGRGAGSVSVLRNHPEQLLAPIAVVWLLIFCWNLLGDALNDVFNPRTR